MITIQNSHRFGEGASLNGLISYYKMDADDGSLQVDEVDTNDLTNSGATYGQLGKAGNSASFAAGNTVQMFASEAGTFSFTDGAGNDLPFSFSFYMNKPNTNNQRIIFFFQAENELYDTPRNRSVVKMAFEAL